MENVEQLQNEIKKVKASIRNLKKKAELFSNELINAKQKTKEAIFMRNSGSVTERLAFREIELNQASINYELESTKTLILFKELELERLQNQLLSATQQQEEPQPE